MTSEKRKAYMRSYFRNNKDYASNHKKWVQNRRRKKMRTKLIVLLNRRIRQLNRTKKEIKQLEARKKKQMPQTGLTYLQILKRAAERTGKEYKKPDLRYTL